MLYGSVLLFEYFRIKMELSQRTYVLQLNDSKMKINITKQSGIYMLTSEQILPISLEKKLMDFLVSPNLDKITPARNGF